MTHPTVATTNHHHHHHSNNNNHHARKKEKRSLEASTYLFLFLYTILALLTVYFLMTESFSFSTALSLFRSNNNNDINNHHHNSTFSINEQHESYEQTTTTTTMTTSLQQNNKNHNNNNNTLLIAASKNVLSETKRHVRVVSPALKQARNAVKTKLSSKSIMYPHYLSEKISFFRLISLIFIIFLSCWLFLRYLLRHVLWFILGKWSRQFMFLDDSFASVSKRVIQLVKYQETNSGGDDGGDDETGSAELSQLEYETSDKQTNYISSTVFDSSSRVKLLILSFIYGAAVYLSQRMQVWCFAIAFIQLLVFHTGKSFWPLLIFTLFIAFMNALSEYNLWRADHQKNTRRVKKTIKSSVTTMNTVQSVDVNRGALRPGDIIRIKDGEEIPADMLIIDARAESVESTTSSSSSNHNNNNNKKKLVNKNRIIFYTNEVQVTGENKPVRKYVFNREKVIKTIEIENVRSHKALINSHCLLDVDAHVAFAGSRLVSKTPGLVVSGIVCWVSTETKALSNPSSSSGGKFFKQPSPFDEYTMKGFSISVIAMLLLATLNAIVAYFYNEESSSVSFGVVWVNHIMYLNMIVPQAMEQLRLVTSAMLCTQFEASNVSCNVPKSIDVFGHATRIVTDKTGTLTENKMVAKATVVFPSTTSNNEHEKQHILIMDESPQYVHTDQLDAHAMAVFATTGMEPEEVAIRSRIESYAQLEFFDPPDTGDNTSGSILFKQTSNGQTRELIIHASFGFQRGLLSKSVIFEDVNSGQYYLGVQAGGDEFWKDVIPFTADSINKLELYSTIAHSYPKFRGAPRIWSHGLKPLSSDEATRLIFEWRESIKIDDKLTRLAKQEQLVGSAMMGCQLISKTHMVDTYRKGVIKGLNRLMKAGKQIIMCTGDSYNAAYTIAKQLGFPSIHLHIDGSSEEAMIKSLQQAVVTGAEQSCTLYFDTDCMCRLQDIENREGGFSGECYELLLSLLESRHQKKKHRYLHCAVFCRATPGLKPWVVQLMQHRHTTTFLENIFWKRHYVIAVGDGINDINMMRVADASMGIFSGETKDVCDQASVWHKEWAPLVDLLLVDGPEKATLLATMVKMIFLKHWLTAFALFADLIFMGFSLLPMDPSHPMLMMIYNAVIFTQIATHSAVDNITDSSALYKKKTMSFRSLTRWVLGAVFSGFATDWVVRWLVPDASANEFGAMIQVGQACSVTMYILLSTNVWSNDKQQQQQQQQDSPMGSDNMSSSGDGQLKTPEASAQPAIAGNESSSGVVNNIMADQRRYHETVLLAITGIFSMVLSVFGSVYMVNHWEGDGLSKLLGVVCVLAITGYPAVHLLIMFNRDAHKIHRDLNRMIHLALTNREELLAILINWAHTKNGRFITTVLFGFAIKLVTGVSLAPLLATGLVISVVSTGIFFVVISRIGFFRALFNGNVLAVSLCSLLIGVYLGRSTKSAVKIPC